MIQALLSQFEEPGHYILDSCRSRARIYWTHVEVESRSIKHVFKVESRSIGLIVEGESSHIGLIKKLESSSFELTVKFIQGQYFIDDKALKIE